jgi:cell division protein FtsZ
MGGGTGTGAAPVIAKLAAKLGILTVGIVTMPFKFEGDIRMKQAQAGMEELQEHVDSMIVINNNKLRDVYGNLGLKAGFAKADEVLATAAKGISEVITTHSGINIDLHDAKTVLEKSGTAIMGAAVASGEDRARVAITKALDSPLLNDNSIRGAKNVLLLIVSGEKEITLDEIGEINEYIQDQSGGGSNIIMGAGEEEGLGDSIRVTVIATGFSRGQQEQIMEKEPKKIFHTLGEKNKVLKSNESAEEVGSVVKKEETLPLVDKPKRIVHSLGDDEERQDLSEQRTVHSLMPEEETPITDVSEKTVASTEKDIMDVGDDEIVIQDNGSSVQTAIEFEFDFDQKKGEEVAPTKEEKTKIYNLEDEVQDEEFYVDKEERKNEHIEASISEEKPKTTFKDGSVRYNLADFEELERKIESATPKEEVVQQEQKEEEPEMQIHTVKTDSPIEERVVSRSMTVEPEETETFIDPTDVPLSKKDQIGRERRERLKRFNYNFKTRSMNSSNIDDYEKQPAYVRAGIDLSSDKHNSASRYSLGNNNDDDLVIRRNNSFLHDNVD